MSPPHVPPKPRALDPPPSSPSSHPSAPPGSRRSAAVWGPGVGCWCWGPCQGWEGGWGGPTGGPGGLREGNQALTQRRSQAGRPGSQKSWCSRRSAGCWRRSRHGRPSGNPLPARSTLWGDRRAGVQVPQNTAPPAKEIPPQCIAAPPHSLGVLRAALGTDHPHPWGPQSPPLQDLGRLLTHTLGLSEYPQPPREISRDSRATLGCCSLHPWAPQTCPDIGGLLTHNLGNPMSPAGH